MKRSLLVATTLLSLATAGVLLPRDEGFRHAAMGPTTTLPFAAGNALSALALSGGAATVHDDSAMAFGLPAGALTNEQRRAFSVGNGFFNDGWIVAPASTEGRDGLGPLHNATSCSACHLRDGRGRPPERSGDALESMLVRLSVPAPGGGARAHPVYGEQFQDKAIPGVRAEGSVRITYREIEGRYGDGEPFSLREPTLELHELGYGPLPPDVLLSARTAPALFGIGLLEAVPEETLALRADPEDRDGDGISGRVRYVVEPRSGQRRAGRFGWKAGAATVEQQSAAAFAGDLGITSSLVPADHATPSQSAARAAPSGGDPELSDHKLQRVVEYQRMLAVPARRRIDEPQVRRGEELFAALRCDACHVPHLRTGAVDDLPVLAHQDIRPYTDLLLHDLGEGLADHRPEGDAPDGADGREWRTPALWGLGLIPTVNDHHLLLHDGRARGPAEAILWHGGEALEAREAFRCSSAEDRAALIAFLMSL